MLFLLDAGRSPATINRALISIALWLDFTGSADNNPARKVNHIEVVQTAPQALTRQQWNAVRREAERLTSKDHSLGLALVSLLRYAVPRVGETAALQLSDVQLSARRGLLVIRRGKGLKRREIPLVFEAREPLEAYLVYRRTLADRWQYKAALHRQPSPPWAAWPDGHLFLGQRGPLTDRGLQEILAKLGAAARLGRPLSPHDLRHTFAKALLDPIAYGLDRPPATLTAVQELLGHASVVTTALYTRATQDELARMMGEDPQ